MFSILHFRREISVVDILVSCQDCCWFVVLSIFLFLSVFRFLVVILV